MDISKVSIYKPDRIHGPGEVFYPHNYQYHAMKWMLMHPNCGMFIDMGLGKTIVTLTVLEWMLYQDLTIDRPLIIAPLRVVQSVWKQEAEKWAHTRKLKISIVWGSPAERINALRAKADIYVTNCENVQWLVNLFQTKWPFDMVILDESSKFKSHASKRFKALQLVRKFITRSVLLTGTPSPNGLLDLWSQIFILDQGERLEKSITGYRNRYFIAKTEDSQIRGYEPRREAVEVIHNKIADICMSMKSEDYIDLPEIIINDIKITLPKNIKQLYDQFEEEQVIEIMNEEITALSAGALTNKLLQFANGAIYHSDKSGEYQIVHDEKLNALADVIDEAQGNPVLVIYAYKHDADRILRKYKNARQMKTQKDIDDWNAGKISIMIGHPASMGHGLNLQSGGHILTFFGLTWSLELYQQVIKRLHRQGQKWVVVINRLICRGTWDMKVVRRLTEKAKTQDDLMNATKANIANGLKDDVEALVRSYSSPIERAKYKKQMEDQDDL